MAKRRVRRVRVGPRATGSVQSEPTAAGALGALVAISERREKLDVEAEKAVAAARDLGVSWERIGNALDMTGNGARKRFGGS